MASPTLHEFRKWMPAQILASVTWAAASENRSKVQVKDGNPGELSTKVCSSPSTPAATRINAPVATQCAEGYSWWRGGKMREVQVGSGSVIGLPSVSARRIAW